MQKEVFALPVCRYRGYIKYRSINNAILLYKLKHPD